MLNTQAVIYKKENEKKKRKTNPGPIVNKNFRNMPQQMPDQEKPEDPMHKKLKDEGVHEGIKDVSKEGEKQKERLDELVDKSTKVLYRAKSSAIPVDISPREVIVDLTKVNVVHNELFSSRRVHSIFIKDISDVFVDSTFMRATLIIVDEGFIDNKITVPNLKKEDAKHLRRIIQGLVVAIKNEVDLSVIDDDNLRDKIEELGKAHEKI